VSTGCLLKNVDNRWLEASLMTHAKYKPCFTAQPNCPFGIGFGQSQRLLAENVLARGSAAVDLLRV
jgi:hypothetical protein